jgi:mannosylfructose-phosphate synthase
LRAMPIVFKRVPQARLVLAVGSTTPNEAEIEMIHSLHRLAADQGISDRVVFKDHISDEQLADYYRAADVFALSSRYEPFGMTAIEAMACGTPTVVTTEGGLCEQVAWGIESLYANPFDPDAFGHAIATVLQIQQVAAQLAKFGPRKARSRFTWSGVVQQLLVALETRRDEFSDDDFDPTADPNEWKAEEATWSV